MRIAIDGVQCSGKTTLLEQLKELLYTNVAVIPEGARLIGAQHGVAKDDDWAALRSDEVRARAFFQDLEQWQIDEEERQPFIIDSSMVLHYCYRKLFGLPTQDLLGRVERYDLILYLERVHECEKDGFRFLDGRDFVEDVYNTEALPLIGSRCIWLPLGADRLRLAVSQLQGLGMLP